MLDWPRASPVDRSLQTRRKILFLLLPLLLFLLFLERNGRAEGVFIDGIKTIHPHFHPDFQVRSSYEASIFKSFF